MTISFLTTNKRTIIDNDAWMNKRVPVNDVIAALKAAREDGYTVVTVGGSGDGLSSWLDVEKPST